jgi:hypothetical protein
MVDKMLNSKSGGNRLNPWGPIMAPLSNNPTIDGIRIRSKKTGPISNIRNINDMITIGSVNGMFRLSKVNGCGF